MKLALLALLLAPQEAPQPGLVAEFFALPSAPREMPEAPAGAPTFARIDAQVDFAPVTGEFHGTKLATNFLARWTGLLRAPKEGLYSFYVESDDGCRLWLDGELVLDNRDGRQMDQKSDRLILKAGDHDLRFEYFQAGGMAGVNLQWKPPGIGRQMIPVSALFHTKSIPEWDRAAWEKRPAPPPMAPVVLDKPGRYASIDYGSLLSRTIEGPAGTFTLKGLAVRVGPEAAVCFDADQRRLAAAWTGKFVTFPTARDGIQGFPSIAGEIRWSSKAAERPPGRYRGLYRHGDKVVFSYTVGEAEILEMPGFESGAFTRTFRVRAAAPVRIGDLEVKPGLSKVSIPETAVSAPEDLDALTKGGPARWAAIIETKGQRGNEPGAYTVDTLTVPYANPWDSYMRLSALDFFADGRAAVGTLDGDVWIVSGIDERLERLAWKRFAAGLYQPLGLRVVDGAVYVLGRDQITRLHDLNGDGEADFYENFNGDGILAQSFHEFATDLQTDPEGNFYFTRAATLGYSNATPHSGNLFRVSKDGAKLEVVATGFRAPNGMAVGPKGEITVTDQQGNWVATCPINWVRPGSFYGFVLENRPETKNRERDLPLCWIPMDMDNSSGGQAWVPDDRWGPFRGRLLHTSYGQSRLFLVLVDEGSDPKQGGVVRFPLSFLTGLMRPRFNPADGQLYVAGMRGWQTTGAKEGGLQRVRYTGRPTRMPVTFSARKGELDLVFAEPVDREIGGDPENYAAHMYRVESTADYGSPEFQVTDPKKRGREPLAIAAAKVSEDGKTVSLGVPGLREGTNLVVKFTIRSADGARMSHEIALTVHRLR